MIKIIDVTAVFSFNFPNKQTKNTTREKKSRLMNFKVRVREQVQTF